MMKMNIQDLHGNWKAGWALDLHTISSIALGDGHFDTTYTDIGLSLNLLKYHQDYSQIDVLANAVVSFMNTRLVTHYIDVIIPTPASINRNLQPVYAIAAKVGNILEIPVDSQYIIKKRDTNQLKDIEDHHEREKALSGVFDVTDSRYAERKVLLFDDLYRSGTTLKEITKTLYQKGSVQNIYVVTLSKTRSKR